MYICIYIYTYILIYIYIYIYIYICVRVCVCVCVWCVFYVDPMVFINKRSCSSKSRCYVFEQDCQGVKCKAPWSVVRTGYSAM